MEIIKIFNVNEYSSWLLNISAPHNCIIAFGLKKKININRLKEAIKIASANEPLLTCSISSKIPIFIKTHNIVPLTVIESEEGWCSIAQKEINKKFSELDALARITVLQSKFCQYIILCFNHIIGDGYSGIKFLSNIMGYYKNKEIEIGEVYTFNDDLKIYPEHNSYIKDKDPIQNELNKTQVHSISFGQKHTKKILAHPLVKQYTLNSFISVNIALAMMNASNLEKINLLIPVNLRKIKKLSLTDKLSFFSSHVVIAIERGTADEMISSYRTHLRKSFRENQHINNLLVLNKRIDERINNMAFIEEFKSSQPTIGINYVEENFPESVDKPFNKINELHLSVNCEGYLNNQSSCTIHIILLNKSDLFIDINYPSPLVCTRKVNDFVCNLKSLLFT